MRQLTACEVFDYAKVRAKAKWDHDVQIAYLNAHLSLYGTLFDGKKFPSVDKFLSKDQSDKPKPAMSKEAWKAMVAGLKANWGTVSEKEAKHLRSENLRQIRKKQNGNNRRQ